MSNHTGKLIVLEGLDGSGKSTQADILAARLREEGHDVLLVREPGGTELGEEIRQLVKGFRGGGDNTDLAQLMLFNAARAQLYERVVKPALDAGKVVIADRSKQSTFAYQGGGGGLDSAMVRQVCDIATLGIEPDSILFVDIGPAERAARINKRNEGTDILEARGDEFFLRARESFHNLARENVEGCWTVVDGEGDLDQVSNLIWDIVETVL